MTVLHGAAVVTPDGIVPDGWVRLDGDRIAEVGSGPARGESLGGGWLVPGFVDVHCHGGAGIDVGSSGAAQAAALHLAHGTTSMLASVVTAPVDALCRQLGVLADVVAGGGTPIVGTHLEGPFLSQARCGAQDPRALVTPDLAAFERMLDAARGTLRMITIAPELPGALEVVDAAVAAGVLVAVGHTDATYDQASAAFDHGATVATHLANGMAPLHHREPGPVLAALDAGAYCEVINDGIHVHPALVRLVAAHDRATLVLITDAMAAAGAGDGRFPLGAQLVDVRDGEARLVDGGALAGSTLTMDRAVARAVTEVGLDLPAAVAAASTDPARLLGLTDRGAIVAGRRADLVHLDDDLRVVRVIAAGRSSGGARS